MYEGRIIKYYRNKRKLTQAELSQGICSTTHISKIERGLTEYSKEITTMLASRLKIDIKEKVLQIGNVKVKLDLFQEAIILQNYEVAKEIKDELDREEMIHLSNYEYLYHLLSIKYYLKISNTNKIASHIQIIQRFKKKLSPYEKNLLLHTEGLYFMALEQNQKAMRTLQKVDLEVYLNPVIYYDLSVACFFNDLSVMSYHYAAKALYLYKQKNNFLGIIDTENLMLIQIESDYREPKETFVQYENLLHLCDICNALDKKAKLLHNYAYEKYKQKLYSEAKTLYEQSMDLKPKHSEIYLLSLEGYIRCLYDGKLSSRNSVLNQVKEGLDIAKNLNAQLFIYIFTMHKYKLLGKTKEYFRYLEGKFIPFLKSKGLISLQKQYEKELLKYYTDIENYRKIIQLSHYMIEHH